MILKKDKVESECFSRKTKKKDEKIYWLYGLQPKLFSRIQAFYCSPRLFTDLCIYVMNLFINIVKNILNIRK